MEPKRTAAIILLLLAIVVTACNLPNRQADPGPLSDEARVNTAAARTIAALATELAAGHVVTVGPLTPTVTRTPLPPTVVPSSATPAPSGSTSTPGMANTPETESTPTSGTEAPCNKATFVRDVTIPDGSTILPNSVFTKTWEIKNSGSCTWNTSYSVVFAGRGSSMSGPAAQPLAGEVKPGENAMVSVPLRAPGEPGDFNGYWMLRSADGTSFGTGSNAAAPFYVEIRVADEYSFAEHICSATWNSAAGALPCPGKEGDSAGYVLPLEDPTLENNQQQEGLALLTAAQPVPGGYITGQFPPVIVPDQSDFRATISCQNGASGCYVRFRVTYRIDNGPEELLGEWNEGYEGGVTQAIKDLDMLAGRPVSFAFTLYVSGDPAQGKGVWLFPRITK